MQVTYLLNGSILNLFVFCLFFVILFYIAIKWLLMRNVASVLPLKSKLSGKFQRFNAINRCIEMLKIVKFSKISIKIKIVKHFSSPKQWTALRNLFSLPPSHFSPSTTRTNLTTSRKQFFFKEIYRNRHLLSTCFKNVVLGRQEMVLYKYFFWYHSEKCLLENLSERFLAVFREHIIFNVKWVKNEWGFFNETVL